MLKNNRVTAPTFLKLPFSPHRQLILKFFKKRRASRLIKLFTRQDQRQYKALLFRVYKRGLFNEFYANPASAVHSTKWPDVETERIHKSRFVETKSQQLAHQLTRRVAFSSSNTMLTFARSWNTFCWTSDTYQMAPIFAFVDDDILHFEYNERRFLHARSIKDPRKKVQTALTRLLHMYYEYTHRSLYRFYMYLHFRNNWHDETKYHLYLTFTANRLFINMVTEHGMQHNYFSLSVGLFLKFLNGKKSLKKAKLIKVLLMKYVRKLLVVSEIRDLVIFTKRTPVFFTELCNALLTPIIRPFYNPFTTFMYDDTRLNSNKPKLIVKQINFYQPKAFGSMKAPRRGRLKRKIMRRIVRANRVCDY